jgi:hypothetical protein
MKTIGGVEFQFLYPRYSVGWEAGWASCRSEDCDEISAIAGNRIPIDRSSSPYFSPCTETHWLHITVEEGRTLQQFGHEVKSKVFVSEDV